MSTGLRTSPVRGLFETIVVFAQFLVPVASRAQTFFGSGGSTNTAANVPNLAFGVNAFASITTGIDNTANGVNTLYDTTSGECNTAMGWFALFVNTTGSNNVALGYGAGSSLTTGSNNIDIGNNGVAAESGVNSIVSVIGRSLRNCPFRRQRLRFRRRCAAPEPE